MESFVMDYKRYCSGRNMFFVMERGAESLISKCLIERFYWDLRSLVGIGESMNMHFCFVY